MRAWTSPRLHREDPAARVPRRFPRPTWTWWPSGIELGREPTRPPQAPPAPRDSGPAPRRPGRSPGGGSKATRRVAGRRPSSATEVVLDGPSLSGPTVGSSSLVHRLMGWTRSSDGSWRGRWRGHFGCVTPDQVCRRMSTCREVSTGPSTGGRPGRAACRGGGRDSAEDPRLVLPGVPQPAELRDARGDRLAQPVLPVHEASPTHDRDGGRALSNFPSTTAGHVGVRGVRRPRAPRSMLRGRRCRAAWCRRDRPARELERGSPTSSGGRRMSFVAALDNGPRGHLFRHRRTLSCTTPSRTQLSRRHAVAAPAAPAFPQQLAVVTGCWRTCRRSCLVWWRSRGYTRCDIPDLPRFIEHQRQRRSSW